MLLGGKKLLRVSWRKAWNGVYLRYRAENLKVRAVGKQRKLPWKFPGVQAWIEDLLFNNVQRKVQVSEKFHLCSSNIGILFIFWLYNLLCYSVEAKEARWQGERHFLHLKTLPESYRDEIYPIRTKVQVARLINDSWVKRLKILEKLLKGTYKRKEKDSKLLST